MIQSAEPAVSAFVASNNIFVCAKEHRCAIVSENSSKNFFMGCLWAYYKPQINKK
jgi:hypothetical protein